MNKNYKRTELDFTMWTARILVPKEERTPALLTLLMVVISFAIITGHFSGFFDYLISLI